MRSARSRGAAPDDRTTRARIRDAAIALVADRGVGALTARAVAELADLSPGSVIHHYGSMADLRTACDHHVAALIRERKQDALARGASVDVVAMLREADAGPVVGYLAAVLTEDSPTVARLVDELVADAEEYLGEGVRSGMLRPSEDARGRAVMLTVWSLGALVMHRHLARQLSVDLTDPHAGRSSTFSRYLRPVYEIFGHGIFSEAFTARADEAVSGLTAPPAAAADGPDPTPR